MKGAPCIRLVTLGALAAAALGLPTTARPHAATSNSVLFEREIVRLLDAHCVMCHVEGGPSFALETYEEVWLARKAIHDAILAGHPPWPAVPGYGDFANENGLTLREKRFVVSWVEGLGPRNAGEVFLNVLGPGEAERPEIRAALDAETWQLGAPDSIARLGPASATEAADPDGPLRMLRRAVALDADDERWLMALEYRPADRKALHAVDFRLASTGQWLATWTPWHGTLELPEGAAYRLPAGATIVADLHVAVDTPTLETYGELGLHFADGTPANAVGQIVLEATSAAPRSDDGLRLQATRTLERETRVLALRPELPRGTRSVEVRARRPDGGIEILLLALDPQDTWPTPFISSEPVVLPADTALEYIVYAADADRRPGALRAGLTVTTY